MGRARKEGQGFVHPVGDPVTTRSRARPMTPPPSTWSCQGTWGMKDPATEPIATTRLPRSMRESGFCLCQSKYTCFNGYFKLASAGRDRSQGTCQKTIGRVRNSPRTLPWDLHCSTKALVLLSAGLGFWSLGCFWPGLALSRRTCEHQ